jgi:uncharacterized Zn-binding protein involved in type VI secretion
MAHLLNTATQMMCPHGGTVTAVTTDARAKAGGGFLVRASDTFTIAGCPIIVAGQPHPCVLVRWVQPNARSRAAGDFTLSEQSLGLCVAADQAVQGTVQVLFTQPRASGS